jgi:hypothetical protein
MVALALDNCGSGLPIRKVDKRDTDRIDDKNGDDPSFGPAEGKYPFARRGVEGRPRLLA